MNWKEQWTGEVLEKIPAGSYRKRLENELHDHLEAQCQCLMEAGRTESEARAEALRMMGAPEKLREEYKKSWQRSWPGRLAAWGYRLGCWVKGFCVMLGAHCLICYGMNDYWYLLDRKIWLYLPLALALIAGACYLGRKFQTARHPAWQISSVVFYYLALFFWIDVSWEAAEDRLTFWEEWWDRYMPYYPGRIYFYLFALCILLGVVFGYMAVRRERRKQSVAE